MNILSGEVMQPQWPFRKMKDTSLEEGWKVGRTEGKETNEARDDGILT